MDDVTPQGVVCGPDEPAATAPADTAQTRDAQAVAGMRIDIVSDAICPWCYIGKRQLEGALASLEQEGLTFQVHWNPFQLNPDMPKEGRDRTAYRTGNSAARRRQPRSMRGLPKRRRRSAWTFAPT